MLVMTMDPKGGHDRAQRRAEARTLWATLQEAIQLMHDQDRDIFVEDIRFDLRRFVATEPPRAVGLVVQAPTPLPVPVPVPPTPTPITIRVEEDDDEDDDTEDETSEETKFHHRSTDAEIGDIPDDVQHRLGKRRVRILRAIQENPNVTPKKLARLAYGKGTQDNALRARGVLRTLVKEGYLADDAQKAGKVVVTTKGVWYMRQHKKGLLHTKSKPRAQWRPRPELTLTSPEPAKEAPSTGTPMRISHNPHRVMLYRTIAKNQGITSQELAKTVYDGTRRNVHRVHSYLDYLIRSGRARREGSKYFLTPAGHAVLDQLEKPDVSKRYQYMMAIFDNSRRTVNELAKLFYGSDGAAHLKMVRDTFYSAKMVGLVDGTPDDPTLTERGLTYLAERDQSKGELS